MTLDEIKAALADRNLQAVAQSIGLNPHTLYRIAAGKTRPHRATMTLLAQYLKGGAVNGQSI
jgi:hypothetical protein